MRLDITGVTFYEVVIDTLVKLCAQATDVGRPSTESEITGISFQDRRLRFKQRRT